MTIHEWIEKLETNDSLSVEQFYARLKDASLVLQERLDCAEADGVDLDNVALDEND